MKGNRGGFVYLMALLVILVVAGIAMLMASGGGLRLRAGSELTAHGQCRNAALGVLRAVVNDLDTAMTAGSPPGLVTVKPEGESVGGCTVVLLGRDPAGATVVHGLISEAGRIDVNNAPAAVLAALPGLDASLAAGIVDWRDGDDEVGDGGAERTDGTYSGAMVSFAPRNAPFESLQELRLVRGITDALWFGEDVNGNGHLDSGEDGDSDGRLDPGLVDVLTIESREPSPAPNNSARIRISSLGAIRSLMTTLFGSERAGTLGEELQSAAPYANRLDLVAALPFKSGEAASLWPYLVDSVMVNGREQVIRTGLLDVATCSEEVLVATVGKDAAVRIIAARPTDATGSDPAWLATALGRELARTVGMRLTVGSYRFRADLVAVRNDGGGWARLDAVIKCADGQASVVEIHPAEARGWPFPWATLERLRRAAPADVAVFLASGQP